METAAGVFTLHVYESTVDSTEHIALVKGDLRKPGPVLVRVHAVNALVDHAGITDSREHGTPVAAAMQMIGRAERGVIVLIRDLRPKAISQWLSAHIAPEEAVDGARERRQVEIGIGSQILLDLGVREMMLLTNSPAYVYTGAEAFGLRVAGTVRIE
jgi:3,4-dihydroxy 2-butanone 4-phosphate synthase/GTP cyclohydrolase II